MQPTILSIRRTAIFALCALLAACGSSPMGVDSEAAKGAKLQVSPGTVDFGTTATTASVTLKNPTKRAMGWTVSERAGWLSVSATSGTLYPGDTRILTMTASRTGLATGTHTADVSVSASNGGGTEVMAVSVAVPSTGTEPARLAVSPLAVDFGTTGSTRSVTLSNTGDASLSWSATESSSWLSLGATSGTIAGKSSQTLTLSAARDDLTAGTYTTSVTLAAGTAGTVTEPVSLTVPSTSTSVLLAGRLIDQFGEQGLGGVMVEYKGATATSAADGSFSIPGTATTSASTLTLSGASLYRRVTVAQTGDALWRVVPTTFSISAFDDLARDEFGSSTVRWTAPPTVYVDTRPEGFSGGPELEKWISEVRVQAADFVSKWTGATIDPANVVVTSSPPKDFSAGTIVIHFSEDNSRYENNTSMIGYARLSWSSSRSIAGAAVWLRYLRYSGDAYAGKRKGILGHELGHAMGMGHMNGSTPSFMSPSLGSKTDLTAFDHMAALLLYTRMPGNTTADTEGSSSPSKALAPSAAPTITEWVCGVEADAP